MSARHLSAHMKMKAVWPYCAATWQAVYPRPSCRRRSAPWLSSVSPASSEPRTAAQCRAVCPVRSALHSKSGPCQGYGRQQRNCQHVLHHCACSGSCPSQQGSPARVPSARATALCRLRTGHVSWQQGHLEMGWVQSSLGKFLKRAGPAVASTEQIYSLCIHMNSPCRLSGSHGYRVPRKAVKESVPVDINRLVDEEGDDGHSIVQRCPLQGVIAHLVWIVQEAGILLCCFSEILIVAVCAGCAHTLKWRYRARAARSTAARKFRRHSCRYMQSNVLSCVLAVPGSHQAPRSCIKCRCPYSTFLHPKW